MKNATYIFGSIFTSKEIVEIFEAAAKNPRAVGETATEGFEDENPFYTAFDNGYVVFPFSKDPRAIVIGKPEGDFYRTVRLTRRNFEKLL